MIALDFPSDYAGWRQQARRLLGAGIEPARVAWGPPDLFAQPSDVIGGPDADMRVPAEFARLAETLFLHRDPDRLTLLYDLLWRLQGDRRLLGDATDPAVAKARHMEKAVRRDIHKMRAFLRFRETRGVDDLPQYIAWFEPEHDIVRANAGFFVRRFAALRWSILTPSLCLHWDGEEIKESGGVAKPAFADDDAAEELWRSYYASIFNPARLKTRAMLKEMPRRYWKNMPETRIIPDLIAGAQAREAAMLATGGASHEPPPESWEEIVGGAAKCRRCPLYRNATQAVHGEGPHDAALMIVGEQPGDQEDLAGRPFIGPAGQLLDRALAQAGIERSRAYLTNAVKHFKHELRGKRRLHQTPTAGEIDRCRWWLDAERARVRPRIVLALGASAVRGLTGRTASISSMRGRPVELSDGARMVVTTHPSYVLRVGEANRDAAMAAMVDDFRLAASLLLHDAD